MTGVDRDILISRVIDGEASPEDWTAFKALAAAEPNIWRELAEAQQDHAELTAAIESAIAIADEVEVPIEVHFSDRLSEKLRGVGRWGGWVAAAAVIAIWVSGGSMISGNRAGIGPNLASPATADEALSRYIDQGWEIGRLRQPTFQRVINNVAPNPDGDGFIVIYDLVIPEIRLVPNPMIEGVNEYGEPVTVPLRPTAPTPSTSF